MEELGAERRGVERGHYKRGCTVYSVTVNTTINTTINSIYWFNESNGTLYYLGIQALCNGLFTVQILQECDL